LLLIFYVEMALLLLIETATDICSCGIARDGTMLVYKEQQVTSHATWLTVLIEQCIVETGLHMKDFDAVGVSVGPGSYSSLRVGVSVAKGICYSLGCPLLSIDTLRGLALGVTQKCEVDSSTVVLPMLDARRDEIWLSAFDTDMKLLAPAQPLVLSNNGLVQWLTEIGLLSDGNRFICVGNGAQKLMLGDFYDFLVINEDTFISVCNFAADLDMKYNLGSFEDVAYLEPVYMKPPNITTSKSKII
jgi:tRNA threonylcarbamoyladenosine biosynthesis protein TsaB